MGKVDSGPGTHAAWPMGSTREELSSLIDGELASERFDSVCQELRSEPAVDTWVCYHVIGDALRGTHGSTPGFASRFAARLAAEPTVLSPRRRPGPAALALAVAATVAAVAVVGWVALTTMPEGNGTIATAMTAARQAASVRVVDARPPVDNEYLVVHQEYSPTTAIQGVRPYLRAVASDVQDARQ